MTEEHQPHPDSPHQRMLDFLAESESITADVAPADPDWPVLEDLLSNSLKDGEDGER